MSAQRAPEIGIESDRQKVIIFDNANIDDTVASAETLRLRAQSGIETVRNKNSLIQVEKTNLLTGVTTSILSVETDSPLVKASRSILELGYSAHNKGADVTGIVAVDSRVPFSNLPDVSSRIVLAQKPGGMAWCVVGIDTPTGPDAKLEVEYLMHKSSTSDLEGEVRQTLDIDPDKEIKIGSLGPFVSFKTPLNINDVIAHDSTIEIEKNKTVGLPRQPLLLWPLIDTFKRTRDLCRLEGVTHVVMIAKERQLVGKLLMGFGMKFTQIDGYSPYSEGEMHGVPNAVLFKRWPGYWLNTEDTPKLWVASIDELSDAINQFVPPDDLQEQLDQLALQEP